MKNKVISVRMDMDLMEKLDGASQGSKLSKATLINAAVQHYFGLSDEERGQILLTYLGQGTRPQ